MTSAIEWLPQKNQDLEVISLVGFVHGVSHFFHLLLPPLFPWLMDDFGLSFSSIGVTMTIFFVVSAIGQVVAGFLVDRLGPVQVLAGGISFFWRPRCCSRWSTASPDWRWLRCWRGLATAFFTRLISPCSTNMFRSTGLDTHFRSTVFRVTSVGHWHRCS